MERVQALPDERGRDGVADYGAHEPRAAAVPSRLQLLAGGVVQRRQYGESKDLKMIGDVTQ